MPKPPWCNWNLPLTSLQWAPTLGHTPSWALRTGGGLELTPSAARRLHRATIWNMQPSHHWGDTGGDSSHEEKDGVHEKQPRLLGQRHVQAGKEAEIGQPWARGRKTSPWGLLEQLPRVGEQVMGSRHRGAVQVGEAEANDTSGLRSLSGTKKTLPPRCYL